ncbi:hypothetical protein CRENBAI_005880, partial [Crenichthys baileyi]
DAVIYTNLIEVNGPAEQEKLLVTQTVATKPRRVPNPPDDSTSEGRWLKPRDYCSNDHRMEERRSRRTAARHKPKN